MPLKEQLLAVGADPDSATIPNGLLICQLGDLVHKGPDSDAVVALVDAFMTANPGQWVQLVGNHEAQYLPGGYSFWPTDVSADTVAMLQSWWESGAMTIAASFHLADVPDSEDVTGGSGGDLLITHAGLTAGAWRLLGKPTDTESCAALLNAAVHPVVWRQGAITGGDNDFAAGPLWAIAASEVYPSWAAIDDRVSSAPVFAQAHGHTSPCSWRHGTWREPLGLLEKRSIVNLTADHHRRVTRVDVSARTFFGTDPGAGAAPASVSVPLTLPLAATRNQEVDQP